MKSYTTPNLLHVSGCAKTTENVWGALTGAVSMVARSVGKISVKEKVCRVLQQRPTNGKWHI